MFSFLLIERSANWKEDLHLLLLSHPDPEFQKIGIGKELIRTTKENIGKQAMLLLLSAPTAMDYYPKVNFEKVENGYIIKREN